MACNAVLLPTGRREEVGCVCPTARASAAHYTITEHTQRAAYMGSSAPTKHIVALAAIALISGIANGYNGTVLEGALPRLRVVKLIPSAWESGRVFGSILRIGV